MDAARLGRTTCHFEMTVNIEFTFMLNAEHRMARLVDLRKVERWFVSRLDSSFDSLKIEQSICLRISAHILTVCHPPPKNIIKFPLSAIQAQWNRYILRHKKGRPLRRGDVQF